MGNPTNQTNKPELIVVESVGKITHALVIRENLLRIMFVGNYTQIYMKI